MMVKLVILIEPEVNQDAFFEGWPRFLEHAENLPGLVRLVSAPVHTQLAGAYQPLMIHELVFDSQQALENALASRPVSDPKSMRERIDSPHPSAAARAHISSIRCAPSSSE